MEPLVVRNSRKFFGTAVAGFGLMFLIFLFVLWDSHTLDDRIKSGLGTLFFLFLTGTFLRIFLDPRPRFVIDDTGVLIVRLGIGVIPWSAIEGVEGVQKKRRLFMRNLRNDVYDNLIYLRLKEPQFWAEKINQSRRLGGLSYARSPNGEVLRLGMSFAGSNLNPGQAVAAIEEKLGKGKS